MQNSRDLNCFGCPPPPYGVQYPDRVDYVRQSLETDVPFSELMSVFFDGVDNSSCNHTPILARRFDRVNANIPFGGVYNWEILDIILAVSLPL